MSELGQVIEVRTEPGATETVTLPLSEWPGERVVVRHEGAGKAVVEPVGHWLTVDGDTAVFEAHSGDNDTLRWLPAAGWVDNRRQQ